MKKILLFSIVLISVSCIKIQKSRTVKYDGDSTVIETGNSSTVTTYVVNSDFRTRGSMTNQINGELYKLDFECQTSTSPVVNINMVLNFNLSGEKKSDTLTTQMFTNLLHLGNVNTIRFDSLDFKKEGEDYKVCFLLSFIENAHSKKTEKCSMVYTTALNNDKSMLVVDRIVKSSVEEIGNSY